MVTAARAAHALLLVSQLSSSTLIDFQDAKILKRHITHLLDEEDDLTSKRDIILIATNAFFNSMQRLTQNLTTNDGDSSDYFSNTFRKETNYGALIEFAITNPAAEPILQELLDNLQLWLERRQAQMQSANSPDYSTYVPSRSRFASMDGSLPSETSHTQRSPANVHRPPIRAVNVPEMSLSPAIPSSLLGGTPGSTQNVSPALTVRPRSGSGRYSGVSSFTPKTIRGIINADRSPGPRRRFVLPIVVYFSKEMREIAEELAQGPAQEYVALREVDWDAFPDGFPKLFIRDIKDCRYNHVLFLSCFHDPAVLFQQLSVIYSLPQAGAEKFTLLVPWFSCGTMERIEHVGEVATAATQARLLSIIPPAASGPSTVVILDIHSLATQHFFGPGVHVRLKSCVSLLVERLLNLPETREGKVAIAFPDDGACKRFSNKFDVSIFGEPIVCVKKRIGDIRRVLVADGEPMGKHCVLVDDLVQSGGTLIQAAKALRDAGAISVSAYTTHAIFARDSWKKFVIPTDGSEQPEPSYIDTFYITNSVPSVANKLRGIKPFEILSIAPIVSDILGF